MAVATFSPAAWTQQSPGAPAEPGSADVHGIYNWIHSTGDAERSFAFYRDILGIELARSPFAGGVPDDRPEPIRPRSQARSDPLVWDLTDTEGSRFRTVFMHAPNTPFGLELSEFLDIPRDNRAPNPWDPGASTLLFAVRDLATITEKLLAAGAPSITLGGKPLDTPSGPAILVRDPDGYLVRMRQAAREEIASATMPAQVVETSIEITIADTAAALKFYRDLLGFEVRGARPATTSELQVYGLEDGQVTRTTAIIPDTDVTVILAEFELPSGSGKQANPYRWKIQDIGAPQFQLQVSELDALLERTAEAGYRILSIGAKPIQRPFGRFVFVTDADGVLVEFVEPRTSQ